MMNNKKELCTLATMIGKWSEKNFGDQPASYPLHGLSEEYGEFLEANHPDDVEDAIADMAIFLMDFCCRADVSVEEALKLTGNGSVGRSDLISMPIHIGRINRAYLKTKQGIRKDEDHENHLICAVGTAFRQLDQMCRYRDGQSLYTVANRVFRTIVNKRDWTEEINDGK